MTQNLTKQQHTVPQFYLRQFASDDGQIWAYDKLKGEPFRTSIRNVGGQRYFYDSDVLERATGDRQALEKFLSGLEGIYSQSITRLLGRLRTGGYCRLHPETRTTIANFAAVQLLRTPERRIEQRQMGEQMIKFLRKHPGTESLIAEQEAAITDDALRESQVAALIDPTTIMEFMQVLTSHIWIIGHRHPKHGFYTSDMPISKHGTAARPGRGNRGIGCKGVEIHIPLSHDYEIILYERTHFEKLMDRAGRLIKDGMVVESTDPLMMVYSRQWQVRDSNRFIYCRDDDFDLVREMCAEDPELKDGNRKRVTSNHDD